MIVTHTDDDPVLRLTEAVEQLTDVPVEELPALCESVDSDALVALMESENVEVCAKFDYAGCRVVATSEAIRVDTHE